MLTIRSFVLAVVASLLGLAPVAAPATAHGGEDAVVIAVIDTLPSPYHRDFLASRMLQATNADATDDLPLGAPPHTYLSGFPDPSEFGSYQPMPLTLDESDAGRKVSELVALDAGTWLDVERSTYDGETSSGIDYYWVPDTKVIGILDFAGSAASVGVGGRNLNAEHGARVSSVSTGNGHGTCPECLLVFLTFSNASNGESAIEWAMSQPWIDVITNSYGFSRFARDRLYSGSNLEAQRTAIERGQTVFFSAGNGVDGGFVVPNTTYFSSQEGPDWIMTVGAVMPSGADYFGSGKAADLAAPGGNYPSLGGEAVGSTGTFSGTSNATPVIAGLYGRALYQARRALDGPSRIQANGVIATGSGVSCAACELGDGLLTAAELKTRLLHGAQPTAVGTRVAQWVVPASVPESRLLSQGHGVYFARLDPLSDAWDEEQERIFGPMVGTRAPLTRPDGERDWFVVDSYCRQHLWGSWGGGYYREGVTPLPAPDPTWPVRSVLASQCHQLFPPF